MAIAQHVTQGDVTRAALAYRVAYLAASAARVQRDIGEVSLTEYQAAELRMALAHQQLLDATAGYAEWQRRKPSGK